MDSPELWVQSAKCSDRNPVARCEEVPPIPPCSVESKSGCVTKLGQWSFDILFLLASRMPATLAQVAHRIYRSYDEFVVMSQDAKSNAELSMSAFLRDNPTYEDGFNKRGQEHMMAQVLNVACLSLLTSGCCLTPCLSGLQDMPDHFWQDVLHVLFAPKAPQLHIFLRHSLVLIRPHVFPKVWPPIASDHLPPKRLRRKG